MAAELLKEFEADIQSLTLVPSDGGRFEVSINGHLAYSKLNTGRHAAEGEVAGLVKKFLKENS